MQLTDEQTAVVDAAGQPAHLVVEALAGTGKTTAMEAVTREHKASTLYIAFNRAVVNEAKRKMGRGTRCATIHELAFKAIGDPWCTRMNTPRMKSDQIAHLFGLEDVWLNGPWGNKRITAGFLGGMVTRSLQNFAKTGDERPSIKHVPLPRTARNDPELLVLFREVRSLVSPVLRKAWADTIAPDSNLPIDGNMIIKMWQLTSPPLPWDRIIVDEAQDLNDAARAVVQAQMHRSQVIAVGDTFQQINAWNGAVNALQKFPIEQRLWLTNCWRFGPQIAEVANEVLEELGSEHMLRGRGPDGVIEVLDEPDVRLSRTNASAVGRALEELKAGGKPHIVGGASDVVSFCRGAIALQQGRAPEHPELVCFDSWGDVLAYAADDELGADLAPLVDLILRFGAQTIVDTLGKQPPEDRADLILSTVHKIKGRQWPKVQIAGDFNVLPGDPYNEVEETRLLYVAATRAQTHLDLSEVPFFPQHQPAQESNPNDPTTNGDTPNDQRDDGLHPGAAEDPGAAGHADSAQCDLPDGVPSGAAE